MDAVSNRQHLQTISTNGVKHVSGTRDLTWKVVPHDSAQCDKPGQVGFESHVPANTLKTTTTVLRTVQPAKTFATTSWMALSVRAEIKAADTIQS
jgi:hypothetical protein